MKRIIAPSTVLVMLLTAILGCGTSGGSGTVTERIDADDGGSITSDDGMLTLEIPAGALAEDTRITIQEVDAGDMPDEFADLGEGMGYELSPEGLTFAEPVMVSLTLDPASLKIEGGDGYEVHALLSWSEEYGLAPLEELVLEISLSEGVATLNGEMDHFSYITRSKSGMTVSLEEVENEQPVGGSFTARVFVSLQYGLTPQNWINTIAGSTFSSEQVEVVGHPDFYFSAEHVGTFQCKTTPGAGAYGVSVCSDPWGRDPRVCVEVVSNVECVAPLPATPPPMSEPPTTDDTGVVTEDLVEIILDEMGFSAEQITQLMIARIFDPTGDWIWSILGTTPGEFKEFVDLLWSMGLLSETDLAALEFWFNLSLFECGELVDGQLTVCDVTAKDFPEGDMLMFAAKFNGDIPLADTDHYYTYSVVMDGDGDASNNFEFMPPYDWDYFQGTDQWYQLIWDPGFGSWYVSLTRVHSSGPISYRTEARAVIAGDTVIFFIPASEVEVERPAFRMTAFGHDGTYNPETGGGDVTGDDPTQPLTELWGEVLQLP